ncbi:glucoamylase family protein [Endozoicomonas montiporae]|uniref:PA14 domain-containing protein n=1 Tax=Endozoicomonas montiporae CL-33 TaxID=570277 RepID=A0A142B8L4_9GAMM|nr:glucoamylase family protein [Endozoicomonas montiporae]AMO55090.1 hypothetical protein EZMO1_0872 [Endozoicomonas montiporae CL-33]
MIKLKRTILCVCISAYPLAGCNDQFGSENLPSFVEGVPPTGEASPGTPPASDIATKLLVGYEPDETLPELSVNGGSAAVEISMARQGSHAYPTEKDYFLSLGWENHRDDYLSIRHDFSSDVIDYDKADFIMLDLYVPEGQEVSSVDMKLEGQVFSSISRNVVNGGWSTIAIDVRQLKDKSSSTLEELRLFTSDTHGELYLDNIRQISASPEVVEVNSVHSAAEVVWRHLDPSFWLKDFKGYNVYRSVVGSDYREKLNDQPVTVSAYIDFDADDSQEADYFVSSVIGSTESELTYVGRGKAANLSDKEFLDSLQRTTFRYMTDYMHPHSGLTRISYQKANQSNNCGPFHTGMATMALAAGVENEFIDREDAARRVVKMLRFMKSADRFRTGWPRWVRCHTGRLAGLDSPDDGANLSDTGMFLQGALVAREYFTENNALEAEIRELASELYHSVDFNLFRDFDGKTEGEVLMWHWSQTTGFEESLLLKSFQETFGVYVLALGSPTHPIPAEVYHSGWAAGGGISYNRYINGELSRHDDTGKLYNGNRLWGGNKQEPLYSVHHNYIAIDPRDLRDDYVSFWDTAHSRVDLQYNYGLMNPEDHSSYGELEWGIMADHDPWGYQRHEVEGKPGIDDNGTISMGALVASTPYLPEKIIPAIRHLYDKYQTKVYGGYGFYDSYNKDADWWSADHRKYVSLNPTSNVVALENHKTGLIWELYDKAPEIQEAYRRGGFVRDADAGLMVSYFENEGRWDVDNLPDLSAMTPEWEVQVSTFHATPRDRATNFGLLYQGWLTVEQSGHYTFYTDSNSPNRLTIDGKKVIEGEAGIENSGTIYLPAGEHPVSAEYFQSTGMRQFTVSYEGPGVEKKVIPVKRLRTSERKS